MADKDDDKGTEDTDTDADDTGTDDGARDDEGDGGDWKPPTRADWDKVQTALRKARRDARAAKRPADDKPADGEKPDVAKAVADATTAEAGRWKPRLVRTAARSAFVEAGLVLPKNNPDGALARVMKLLDLDELDITDDGEIDGLAEQVEDIKADFPELFAASGRSRAGKVDGADKPGSKTPKTAVERLTAQIMAG